MKSRDECRLQRALVEAIGFMELSLPARAIDRLERVADLGKNDVHWNVLMGEALRSLERFGDAIRPLETAVHLAPEAIDVYLSLGWCYKRSRQLSQAIRALETARRLQPDSDLVMYNLACYYSLAGQKDEALSYLARAFRHSNRWRELAAAESDFDNLRNDPAFQRLVHVGLVRK